MTKSPSPGHHRGLPPIAVDGQIKGGRKKEKFLRNNLFNRPITFNNPTPHFIIKKIAEILRRSDSGRPEFPASEFYDFELQNHLNPIRGELMSERCLLCVETEKDICTLIERILERFEAKFASTIRGANRLLAENSFDLLLINSHLPDGSGLELCRAVRKADSRTPILFILGDLPFNTSEIEDAGAQGYIRKGLGFVEELETKVGRLFQSDNRSKVSALR